MHDIINFGFHSWNEKCNWWVPNTVPCDFILDGIKSLPATHGNNWIQYKYQKACQDPENPVCVDKKDYLCKHPGVNYKFIKDLSKEKYILPIMIRDGSYFYKHKDIGFRYIEKQVIDDVKNNRAKIILMFPLEGFSGTESNFGNSINDFDILNNWCIKHSFTKNQVYYLHGNWKSPEKIDEYNFTYIPVNAFYSWLTTQLDDIVEYKPLFSKNLFLSYNRRFDIHRMLFVCEVIKHNLMDRGLISYLGKWYPHITDKKAFGNNEKFIKRWSRTDLIDAAKLLDRIQPLQVGIDLDKNNPVNEIIIKHHESTFLSVVTETLWRDGTIFFSEKILKPLLAGQPFMIIAGPGYLEELKRQGYKTFNNWWNEDYDNELSLEKRIRMVIDELTKLSQLTINELFTMREEMKSILRHNQKLYHDNKSKLHTRRNDEYLYLEIKKIWDTF